MRHTLAAVHYANLTGSGILVSSALDVSILDYIHKNSETPVVYIGEFPPKLVPYYTFYALEWLKDIVGWKPIIDAVAYMYDVDIPKDLWGKIERIAKTSQLLEPLLKVMVSLGVVNERVLSRVKEFYEYK